MSEHSKTPWRVFVNKDGTKLVGIGKPDGEGILDAGFGVWAWNDPEGIANAHMVVRAVNSHEALVKALKSVRLWCECVASETELAVNQPALGVRQTIKEIDAALALVDAERGPGVAT